MCCGHWSLLKMPTNHVFKVLKIVKFINFTIYKCKLVLKKGQGGMSIPSQLWPGSRHDFPPSFFSFNTSSADVSPGKPHRIHLSFNDSWIHNYEFLFGEKRDNRREENNQENKKNPLQAVLSQWEQWHFTAGFNTEHTLLKITFLC